MNFISGFLSKTFLFQYQSLILGWPSIYCFSLPPLPSYQIVRRIPCNVPLFHIPSVKYLFLTISLPNPWGSLFLFTIPVKVILSSTLMFDLKEDTLGSKLTQHAPPLFSLILKLPTWLNFFDAASDSLGSVSRKS